MQRPNERIRQRGGKAPCTRVSVNIVNTGGLLGVGSRVARGGIREIGN